MAQKDQFKKFHYQHGQLDWLGVFCAPMPPTELSAYVLSLLPPSYTISYTNKVDSYHQPIYQDLGIGVEMLVKKDFTTALQYFQQLADKYPDDDRITLGLLKAQQGKAQS